MTAIFGPKNNKETKTADEVVMDVHSEGISLKETDKISNILRNKSVLLRPRITEKASDMQIANNVYTFDVMLDANKVEINTAIRAVYGVTPIKTRIVKVPSKKVRTRKGGKGVKSGGKKVYVYLKKGDSIEFV